MTCIKVFQKKLTFQSQYCAREWLNFGHTCDETTVYQSFPPQNKCNKQNYGNNVQELIFNLLNFT